MTGRASTSRALRVAPKDIDAAAFDGPGTDILVPTVLLGHAGNGDPVVFELETLLETRLLIQGMSGAGKSWLLRRLLETTADTVQQVVIDPEGEFRSLAERFGHVSLDAVRLDAEALGEAAARARRTRAHLWVDLSQCDRARQMVAVAAVLNALLMVEGEHWHACLVAIDEAHLFAPQGGGSLDKRARLASLAAVVDLMSRGRKRGLCGVMATQRLGALARSVASEAGNVLVGLNAQDIDIARAAAAIGWPVKKADGILRFLRPGHFIGVGPAFALSSVEVRIATVTTRHHGSTPRLGPPPPRDGSASAAIDVAGLESASDVRTAALMKGRHPQQASSVRAFLREPAAASAARISAALLGTFPFPELVAALCRALDLSPRAVEEGIALLESYGLARRGRGEDGPTVVAL